MSVIVNQHKYYLHVYETYLVLIDQQDQKKRCKFLKSKYYYLPIVDLVNDFNKSMEHLQ